MDLIGRKGLDIAVTTIFPGYIASEMNEKVEQEQKLMVDTETGVRAMLKAGSSYCRAMSRTCRRYRYRVQFRPRSEAARPPAGSGRCDLAASP